MKTTTMGIKRAFLGMALLLPALTVNAEPADSSAAPKFRTHLSTVAPGYSRTSVNTTVFRNSSLATHGRRQYVSFYDPEGYVTLGWRRLGSDKWHIRRTPYRGKVEDAHNVISMGIDGQGYIHLSFDHHGSPLRYCRSVRPGSLEMGPLQAMTGSDEDDVTYPEFYTLPSGNLIFAYRSGASGRGNLVLNRYDISRQQWTRLHDVLIDGENQRNAYWQLCVDSRGWLHLSWVWRETWLVETNHDLCYARSRDGGLTWERSDGTPCVLPIRAANAEYAFHIPQRSELINQTSMTADADGHPYIATYWRDSLSQVPQYRLVWHDGRRWQMQQVGRRTQPFSLSGGGTKMIPIARPRLVTDGEQIFYIMRDAEQGSRVRLAYNAHLGRAPWQFTDLTDFSVDAWEPSLDTDLWRTSRKLDIFVQHTRQGDGEQTAEIEPQAVQVLSVKF